MATLNSASLRPNIHRSHCDPNLSVIPLFLSKGKDLGKLVAHYSSYAHNTNVFSNLTLSTHTRGAPPVVRPSEPTPVPGNFALKTQLMREHDSRDTRGHIYGIKDPSNLAQPAIVNDRYDCTVFEQKEDGPGAAQNVYFYESLKDPVKDSTQTRERPFVRDMLVHSEYDHDCSLHNQLLQSARNQTVQQPPAENPLSEVEGALPFYCSRKTLLDGIKGVMY